MVGAEDGGRVGTGAPNPPGRPNDGGIKLSYDVPCRPTPLPARAPIPAGWRTWSHGNEATVFRTILGIERPPGMILVERCCLGRAECNYCAPLAVNGKVSARG
jgi:hypothetical protein